MASIQLSEGSGGRIHIEPQHRIVAEAVRARIHSDGVCECPLRAAQARARA